MRIMEGSLKSSDVVRVTRAGEVLGEAKLTSLRHFKEQVTFRAFFRAFFPRVFFPFDSRGAGERSGEGTGVRLGS